jgi:hypothetical protein
MLEGLHLWSEHTVRQRFAYRSPGLFVLPVRVFRVSQPHLIQETSAYAGCRSWVELTEGLSTANAQPVLDDATFTTVLRQLDAVLNPTAFA